MSSYRSRERGTHERGDPDQKAAGGSGRAWDPERGPMRHFPPINDAKWDPFQAFLWINPGPDQSTDRSGV